jgi:hypothetical protein
VTTRPGGTTVACTGSEAGDWTCTVSSREERCFANLPNSTTPVTDPAAPPTDGNEQPSDDPAGGGGAGVDPGGSNEPPTDPGTPDGGGHQPSDGGGSDGGGVVLTSYHGDTHGHAKQHGTHSKGHKHPH